MDVPLLSDWHADNWVADGMAFHEKEAKGIGIAIRRRLFATDDGTGAEANPFQTLMISVMRTSRVAWSIQ